MEVINRVKTAGEKLAEMIPRNEKVDEAIAYFKEQKEPKRTLIFTWTGLAHQWREYSDHMMKDFMKHDEDVRIKLWGNDVY